MCVCVFVVTCVPLRAVIVVGGDQKQQLLGQLNLNGLDRPSSSSFRFTLVGALN